MLSYERRGMDGRLHFYFIFTMAGLSAVSWLFFLHFSLID